MELNETNSEFRIKITHTEMFTLTLTLTHTNIGTQTRVMHNVNNKML